MSTAILTLSENGYLQRIHDKWLKNKICSDNSQLDPDQLQLKSFWGLFLMCGIACFLALLVNFCMMFRQFSREFPEKGHGSSRNSRLQTFLSFVDEKAGGSKGNSKRKREDTPFDSIDREEDESRNGSRLNGNTRL